MNRKKSLLLCLGFTLTIIGPVYGQAAAGFSYVYPEKNGDYSVSENIKMQVSRNNRGQVCQILLSGKKSNADILPEKELSDVIERLSFLAELGTPVSPDKQISGWVSGTTSLKLRHYEHATIEFISSFRIENDVLTARDKDDIGEPDLKVLVKNRMIVKFVEQSPAIVKIVWDNSDCEQR